VRNKVTKRLIFTGIILLAFIFAGCVNPGLSLEDIVANTQGAFTKIQTFRVDHESTTILGSETTHISTLLEFVALDRQHSVSQHQLSDGTEQESESFKIYKTVVDREKEGDQWHIQEWGLDDMTVRSPADSLIQSMGELVKVKWLKDEGINGTNCIHFIGSLGLKEERERQIAGGKTSKTYFESPPPHLFDSIENVHDEMEFWIGKDDYLLRKARFFLEETLVKDKGKDTEEEKYSSLTWTYIFYDFNKPIDIQSYESETIEGVRLIVYSTGTVDGDTWEDQKATYSIIIINDGTRTARNLEIYIDTSMAGAGQTSFKADADIKNVSLDPGDSVKYRVSWEFDPLAFENEGVIGLMRENIIRASWMNETGIFHEGILHVRE
jgi:hypothetical protein